MIQLFEARNYGCLRKVSLNLTPLHALIGPNDSGKSTILSAVRLITEQAAGRGDVSDAERRRFAAAGGLLRASGPSGSFEVEHNPRWAKPKVSWHHGDGRSHKEGARRILLGDEPDWIDAISGQFRGAVCIRFDPAELRKTSALTPKGSQIAFANGSGLGLPGIYQAILGRNRRGFDAIEQSIRELFPTVKSLRVEAMSQQELTLETELVDGTIVPADLISDGLLYYLGFAVVPHLAEVGVLLVEEPENGLHPARVRDVVKVLRGLVESTGTQVIMATHSPLVINELKPDEVSVVTRDGRRGTQVQLMKDTPNFERRSKSAELGELWLTYADGKQEAPLLGDRSSGS